MPEITAELARDMLRREFHVKKAPVPCMIMTSTGLIEGEVHKRGTFRLKDELNREESYIAVTNAVIYDRSSEKSLKRSFIVLRAEQIIWVAPNEEGPEGQ
jgi:hypothetical protein